MCVWGGGGGGLLYSRTDCTGQFFIGGVNKDWWTLTLRANLLCFMNDPECNTSLEHQLIGIKNQKLLDLHAAL